MSPSRRTPYRPPRPRREVVTAAAASIGLILFTVLMVWVLGPHSSSSGSGSTVTTSGGSAATTPTSATSGTTTPTTGSTSTSNPPGK